MKMKQSLLINSLQDHNEYKNNDIDGLFNYAKQKLSQEQKRLHTFQIENKKMQFWK